jgi:hypothetical protein
LTPDNVLVMFFCCGAFYNVSNSVLAHCKLKMKLILKGLGAIEAYPLSKMSAWIWSL